MGVCGNPWTFVELNTAPRKIPWKLPLIIPRKISPGTSTEFSTERNKLEVSTASTDSTEASTASAEAPTPCIEACMGVVETSMDVVENSRETVEASIENFVYLQEKNSVSQTPNVRQGARVPPTDILAQDHH